MECMPYKNGKKITRIRSTLRLREKGKGAFSIRIFPENGLTGILETSSSEFIDKVLALPCLKAEVISKKVLSTEISGLFPHCVDLQRVA